MVLISVKVWDNSFKVIRLWQIQAKPIFLLKFHCYRIFYSNIPITSQPSQIYQLRVWPNLGHTSYCRHSNFPFINWQTIRRLYENLFQFQINLIFVTVIENLRRIRWKLFFWKHRDIILHYINTFYFSS